MPLLQLGRRSHVLFLALVVGQVVLVSAQVTSKSGMPLLQAAAFGAVAAVQRVGAAAVGAATGFWREYVDLRGLRDENARLAQELGAAQLALQRERALAVRSTRLMRLLEFRDTVPLQTTAAQIIAAAPSPEFRTVTLDKGRADGLRPDMAVLAPGGVVGRIIVPSVRAAKVQLLVDRSAAAGAVVERTRAQGVAVGTGDPGRLRLDYVAASAELAAGDTVVTSGVDGIYPAGYVIGRITRVERAGGAYGTIEVTPAVDFTSLEEVLVVLTPPAAVVEARP